MRGWELATQSINEGMGVYEEVRKAPSMRMAWTSMMWRRYLRCDICECTTNMTHTRDAWVVCKQGV